MRLGRRCRRSWLTFRREGFSASPKTAHIMYRATGRRWWWTAFTKLWTRCARSRPLHRTDSTWLTRFHYGFAGRKKDGPKSALFFSEPNAQMVAATASVVVVPVVGTLKVPIDCWLIRNG